MFEIELYKNPDANACTIWNNLYKKYLFIEGINKSKRIAYSHYISYPIYMQNYLLAEIISWQVHQDLFTKFGPNYSSNTAIGEYLRKNYWKDGENIRWNEKLRQTTGKYLDIDGYLNEILKY